MKDRFVAKRYINVIGIACITLCFTIIVGLLHGLFWDYMFSLFVVDFIFLVLFVYMLEHERGQKNIAQNRETRYRKICIGFLISALIMFAGSYLPEYLKPALFVAVIMTGLSTKEIGLSVGIFYDILLCLMLGSSIQELSLCCLMTLFGCILVNGIVDRKTQVLYGIILTCISAMLPELFYYIAYREIKLELFILGLSEGLVLVIVLIFIYPRMVSVKQAEVTDTLDDMLDSMYPLYRELSGFSKAELQHAKRVSETAKKCATLVNANEKICAAAGFYYRIGILEGGSMVENGVKIAQRECFPEEVIQILAEYNGEAALPSTVESALVHMVDGLIKKLEVLGEQATVASGWNQDMVIYQTLNDFSAKGLYDKSGLSMNMFLKIREYLVKEEALL